MKIFASIATGILLLTLFASCDLLWAPPNQNVFGGTATTSSSEGSTALTAVELFNDNWYADSFGTYKTNWYRFYASYGSTNYVYWNDSYSGSGSYTADIYVTAYQSDLYTTYFLSSDSAYTTPKTVVPTYSGYIYLKAYSSYTGTYAIKYSNAQGSSSSSNVPTSGLVGEYLFSGNANDSSGYGNNGTVSGATLTTDRFGNTSKAYYFDGVNDYIDLNNGLKNSGLTTFSIALWIKSTETRSNSLVWNNPTLIGICSDGEPSGDFGIISKNGKIGMWGGLNSGGDNSYISTSSISDNTFHFITVVNDGSTIKLYKDNTYLSSMASGMGLNAIDFFVGANYWYGAYYFHQGTIDDVRIYNRALTAAEITALYNATN